MTRAAKNEAQNSTETRNIRDIALSQLDLSPLNPRQNVTEEEISALADSIRTVGLMQNLAGIEAANGRIGIVAGGRRLRALKYIAAEAGNNEVDYWFCRKALFGFSQPGVWT